MHCLRLMTRSGVKSIIMNAMYFYSKCQIRRCIQEIALGLSNHRTYCVSFAVVEGDDVIFGGFFFFFFLVFFYPILVLFKFAKTDQSVSRYCNAFVTNF